MIADHHTAFLPFQRYVLVGRDSTPWLTWCPAATASTMTGIHKKKDPKSSQKPKPGHLIIDPVEVSDPDDSLYSDQQRNSVTPLQTYKATLALGQSEVVPESPIDVTGHGSSSGNDQLLDSIGSPATPSANKLTRGNSTNKKKCPCGKSDPSSTYVICCRCKQQWHNKCCNLEDLNSSAIKKLSRWQCPSCYICPALGKLPASVYADLRSTKDAVASLCLREHSVSQGVQAEIAALREQVAELSSARSQNLPPELPQPLSDLIGELTQNIIPNIELKLTDMNTNISNLQSNCVKTNVSKTSGTKTTKSPPSPGSHRTSPNTTSPHVKAKANITPCSPYVEYKPSTIPQDLKHSIMGLIQDSNSEFVTVGSDESREVLYFGKHEYRYTGHKHAARELPEVLVKTLEELAPHLPSDCKPEFNSCLISRYKTGHNHIPFHRDNEPVIDPESTILTLSLGAQRTMSFMNNDESQIDELVLEDSSLLISSRYAQDFWRHGILSDSCTEERVSLTFRNISPHFINSTIVLGDSNTSKINFGNGAGTLGAWLPGKRVKAGHIEALPEAKDIGPYRNVIIHTGINSVNQQRFRKSNNFLLHCLESKCRNILEVYPRCKVHISLLLPSRSRALNHHIAEFNRGILDMTYKLGNVFVIDNSIFGDVLSDEHGRWDSRNQRPFFDDLLHLGKKGIRNLAMNFKLAVLGERSQSRQRFNASQGAYQTAINRTPGHRDGYQPPP